LGFTAGNVFVTGWKKRIVCGQHSCRHMLFSNFIFAKGKRF